MAAKRKRSTHRRRRSMGKASNTLLYVGIGAVVLVGAYYVMKKPTTTVAVPVATNPNLASSNPTNTALNDATSILNNIL